MLVFLVAGLVSYLDLGREEDPEFTVKTMVVQANWPGASIDETLNQVTDRLEKKLEELDTLDYTRSVTTAGKSVVFVFLKDTTRAQDVKNPDRGVPPPDRYPEYLAAGRLWSLFQRPVRRCFRQYLCLHR